MPAATQLMLGTVKLEETDFAITSDQAVEAHALSGKLLSLVKAKQLPRQKWML